MATFIDNDYWAIKKGYDYFVAFQITTVAASSLTTGDHFFYTDGSGTKYYVWMDKNGDGTTDDPSPGGGKTGVACDISGATTAAEVATIIKTAIDALTYSTALVIGDDVEIQNTSNDGNSIMTDVNTDFTFETLGYWSENEYPKAATLTSFRETGYGEMKQWLTDDPSSGSKFFFCQGLEYRIVELMIDEEQGRSQEVGRSQFTPRDYIGTRDRMKLLSLNSISGRRTTH